MFAEAIHKASNRSHRPFIAINCGAIPSSLFESELFGYEKGAFTGALKGGKKGKIDVARGGTLFLDEIGELPLESQAKLLRVLQEKEFYRVGGNKAIPVEARIIAATNKNLKEMVERKTFREDLYYRLNVLSLSIPPLRERREDVFALIELFLNEFAAEHELPVPDLDEKVMYILLHYDWPGNVRELRNVIQRIVVLGADDGIMTTEHLPKELLHTHLPKKIHHEVVDTIYTSEGMKIQDALRVTYGNKSAAAKMLGISRGTLYNKIKKLQLPLSHI